MQTAQMKALDSVNLEIAMLRQRQSHFREIEIPSEVKHELDFNRKRLATLMEVKNDLEWNLPV